ncbi:MAG: YbaB/EbfC family nucleoid-associated protein [Candidatus Nealsonbacteria bacterium]
MFDKLKQLKQLKEIKDSLAKETFEAERDGTKVILNGNLSVEQIILNSELDKERQESVLRDCFNDSIRKAQMAMAERFKGLM